MASVAGTSYVFGAQGSDEHGPLDIAGVSDAGRERYGDGDTELERCVGRRGAGSRVGAVDGGRDGEDDRVEFDKRIEPVYSMRVYLTGDGNGLLLWKTPTIFLRVRCSSSRRRRSRRHPSAGLMV